jgi:hypothetical protein
MGVNSSIAKLIVYVATAVWGLLSILSLLPAAYSVMLFDAPGADKQVGTVAFAVGLVSFPALSFAAIVKSWRGF